MVYIVSVVMLLLVVSTGVPASGLNDVCSSFRAQPSSDSPMPIPAFKKNDVVNIDCVNDMIDEFDKAQMSSFYKNASQKLDIIGEWNLSEYGRIESYQIEGKTNQFWILSFRLLRGSVRKFSIRGYYEDIDNISNICSTKFRPENFATNDQAVAFLRRKYNDNDTKIIEALQSAGAEKFTDGEMSDSIGFKIDVSPDKISEFLSNNKAYTFFLTYRSGKKFVNLSADR